MDKVRALREQFSDAGVWGVTEDMIRTAPNFWTPDFANRLEEHYRRELASQAASEALFAPLMKLLQDPPERVRESYDDEHLCETPPRP